MIMIVAILVQELFYIYGIYRLLSVNGPDPPTVNSKNPIFHITLEVNEKPPVPLVTA